MRTRTLTPELKKQILYRWVKTQGEFLVAKGLGAIPENPGGMGYPDPEMFTVCDRLNSLPGIVTMQSCAGHVHPGEEPGVEAMWSGQLWIGMSEPVRARYISRIDELLIHSYYIERCKIIFMLDQIDVADIIFAGMNRGPSAFADSVDIIYDFFHSITPKRMH